MPDFHLRDLTWVQRTLLVGTLAGVVGFALLFFLEGNYEFIGYFSFLLFFIFFILITLRETKLPTSLLALLSLWVFLHMAGGGVQVAGGKLYDLIVFPIYGSGTEFAFLRYDQLIHLLGTALVASSLHWSIRINSPQIKIIWRMAFASLAAMGLGTLNEMIEFAAVIILPSTGVRGYFNNELDLVFNALGAIIAVVGIELYIRLKSAPR